MDDNRSYAIKASVFGYDITNRNRVWYYERNGTAVVSGGTATYYVDERPQLTGGDPALDIGDKDSGDPVPNINVTNNPPALNVVVSDPTTDIDWRADVKIEVNQHWEPNSGYRQKQ